MGNKHEQDNSETDNAVEKTSDDMLDPDRG